MDSKMIISKEKKFIFAAFNKTGSQSMEAALEKYKSGFITLRLKMSHRYLHLHSSSCSKDVIFTHLPPRCIKRLVGEEFWGESYKFTFVRNPWARVVSLYFHHRRDRDKYPLAQEDFQEWLRLGGTGSVKKLMSDFACDENGNVIVDFIGRFENLERDFRTICCRIGIDCELPHLNKTNHQDYRCYYTEETKEMVRDWARKDIEMFGYEF